jgi:outer membrane protein assembly factor BamB
MPGDDRVRGLDLRTGRMRWTRPYAGTSTLRATALVDGVMLLDNGVTVTALDVRSGTDRWHAAVDAGALDAAVLTDGEVVLLPVRTDGGALRLVAREIADGTVAWRSDVPAGTVAMAVVDHHLVAATDDEVIGLG